MNLEVLRSYLARTRATEGVEGVEVGERYLRRCAPELLGVGAG